MTDDTLTLPQYLTAAEVAEHMRVSTDTVYRWIDEGQLIALRLGRRTTRIFRDDFIAFRDARHRDAHDRATSAAQPAPVPHIPGQTEFPMPRIAAGPIDGIAAL